MTNRDIDILLCWLNEIAEEIIWAKPIQHRELKQIIKWIEEKL